MSARNDLSSSISIFAPHLYFLQNGILRCSREQKKRELPYTSAQSGNTSLMMLYCDLFTPMLDFTNEGPHYQIYCNGQSKIYLQEENSSIEGGVRGTRLLLFASLEGISCLRIEANRSGAEKKLYSISKGNDNCLYRVNGRYVCHHNLFL